MYCTRVTHTTGRGPEFEVVEYREGWGLIPIMGSGNVMKCTIDDPRVKGRKISCLTESEYLVYERANWPTQWDYRQTMVGASLDSAGL